jgi:hypothetical protein
VAAAPGGPRTKWTPRARTLAAVMFLIAALVGFGAALFGAVCDSPSLSCLQNEGKNAVRIAVVAAPFIAYAVYRFTRGGGEGGDSGA